MPWSPLQGSDRIALRKFILKEREFNSVLSTPDITRWDPLNWPINNICSDPGHKFKFSVRITQAPSEQQAKSQSKTVTSHLLKGKLPQLWDGSMWLTPGYGHLSLKAPLCWGQLNHTKDDQPSNIRKLGWLPYEQCLHIITLRESDWYGTDWVR